MQSARRSKFFYYFVNAIYKQWILFGLCFWRVQIKKLKKTTMKKKSCKTILCYEFYSRHLSVEFLTSQPTEWVKGVSIPRKPNTSSIYTFGIYCWLLGFSVKIFCWRNIRNSCVQIPLNYFCTAVEHQCIVVLCNYFGVLVCSNVIFQWIKFGLKNHKKQNIRPE